MRVLDDPTLEKLRSTWENRREDPVGVAGELESIRSEHKLEPHKLGLLLGVRPGEMLTYLVITSLEEEIQNAFQNGFLSVFCSVRLSDLSREEQLEFLEFYQEHGSTNGDSLDALVEFIRRKKEEEQDWKAGISGYALTHLASKAKSYSVLSKKKRSVLYKFGVYRKQKYTLTPKQEAYLSIILDELWESGIIHGGCFNENCNICAKLKENVPEIS